MNYTYNQFSSTVGFSPATEMFRRMTQMSLVYVTEFQFHHRQVIISVVLYVT